LAFLPGASNAAALHVTVHAAGPPRIKLGWESNPPPPRGQRTSGRRADRKASHFRRGTAPSGGFRASATILCSRHISVGRIATLPSSRAPRCQAQRRKHHETNDACDAAEPDGAPWGGGH